MTWLAPIPHAIPAALRELPYVGWRAETRGEGVKPTKIPFQIAYPSRKASVTDAATWATFDDAVDAWSCPELGLDGFGPVLTVGTSVACIDLDDVLDEEGHLDPRAAIVVARANSWTEISPSGRGLHVFVRGSLPAAIVGVGIEVYSTERYIAMTGHRWPGTPDDVHDGQPYLDELMARYIAFKTRGLPPARPYTGPRTAAPDDLAGALLAKLEKWNVRVTRVKRWQNGFLVELVTCPWAAEHTTGAGGAAVMIRASGAYDFVCLHGHCGHRTWTDFRAVMEGIRR